ncbi:DUF2280 domain-containing protein [Comamonadaceae bacterium PP-2]
MAVLPENVKVFVVQSLACFDTPSQIAAAVKAEFGIEVSRQQVSRYDPTRARNKDVSPRLRTIFETARAKFVEDLTSIPISHRSYRLRALQRSLERADAQGNIAMASTLLEQAAKEMGGMYTNRRELSGPDGGPITSTGPSLIQLVAPDVLQQAIRTVRDEY